MVSEGAGTGRSNRSANTGKLDWNFKNGLPYLKSHHTSDIHILASFDTKIEHN